MKHEDAMPRKGLLERFGLWGESCLAREVTMILLQDASLCASCDAIVNATSDACPACAARGSLLSLSAVLNRQPLDDAVLMHPPPTPVERLVFALAASSEAGGRP